MNSKDQARIVQDELLREYVKQFKSEERPYADSLMSQFKGNNQASQFKRGDKVTPLDLAILFHDTYESLAPQFGYETRLDTRQFDEHTSNGKLMIAVCGVILEKLSK